MKFNKLHIFKEYYLVSLTFVYTYDSIATIKIKNISISPKCFFMLLGNSSPTSCPFPPLYFLSFCISLPFLFFLYKWNHIVYIVFCLVSFSLLDYFESHSWCYVSIVHSFLLLVVFHWMAIPQFTHSPAYGHLGCF